MVFHERQRLEMIVRVRQSIEVVRRLAARVAQDALLLRPPGARIDAEGEQVPMQRARQRPGGIDLAAEGPRGELGADDCRVQRVPGAQA